MSGMVQSVGASRQLKEVGKFNSMINLTTYGALSCELAFLQSFAICFTLVDQSVERRKKERSCNANNLTELTRYVTETVQWVHPNNTNDNTERN